MFPERPDAAKRRRAARQRDGHADVSRRSADAGRRRDCRAPSGWRLKDAPTLTKIPVLPISYGDAQPLLAALNGRSCLRTWRGGAADHLSLRSGPAQVHLKLAFNWDQKPLYDVIAQNARDRRFPDEWIVRGNHHDAWVNGAEDPVSGMAADARGGARLGELVKQRLEAEADASSMPPGTARSRGCSDSTEWVEQHDEELQEARGRLHQLRRQRPRLSASRRLAHARAFRERRRAGRRRS